MGRSANSFNSWVGHAEEAIDEDRVTLPEKDLWVAVLTRAALDACKGPPNLDMSRRANVSHKNHWNYKQFPVNKGSIPSKCLFPQKVYFYCRSILKIGNNPWGLLKMLFQMLIKRNYYNWKTLL